MAPTPQLHRPGKPAARPVPRRRYVWPEVMATDMPAEAGPVALEHLLDRTERRDPKT